MRELPYFQEVHESQPQVVFLVLARAGSGDPREVAERFTMTFGTDAGGMQAYGFTVVPSTLFIDADGNVTSRHVGALNKTEIEAAISNILH